MNGEIPSVPITTLAGTSSLTDLLPELPLPTPLPHTTDSSNLLHNQQLLYEAQNALNSSDPNLIAQLLNGLRRTNTKHIELKDTYSCDVNDVDRSAPLLLKSLLYKDPNLFSHQPCMFPPNESQAAVSANVAFGQPAPPQHSSPYQAGQSSPCPPGSPARYTPQNCSTDFLVNGGNVIHNKNAAFTPDPMPYDLILNHNLNSTDARNLPGYQGYSSSAKRTPAHPSFYNQTNRIAHNQQFSNHSQDENSSNFVNPSQIQALHKQFNKMPEIKLKRLDDSVESSNYQVSSNNSLKLCLSKHSGDSSKGLKRESEDIQNFENVNLQEIYGDYGTSLSERVKRRRHIPNYTDDSLESAEFTHEKTSERFRRERHEKIRSQRSREKRKTKHQRSDSEEEWEPPPDTAEVITKKKERKVPHHSSYSSVSIEDQMDSPTFKRFYQCLESILESTEELNLRSLHTDDENEGDGPAEGFISRSQLHALVHESAKLKSLGVMNQVPYEKLVKVLNVLQYSVRDGFKVIPPSSSETHPEEDELWREISSERIGGAVDAALVSLNIMTSGQMPKQVFIEDVIERLVMMIKVQLHNSIFPEYDPVYRISANDKSYYQSSKSKRAKAGTVRHKSVVLLYNKLTDSLGLLAELVNLQELTDTIILQISSLSVIPFFVENISELQLNSLKLVTNTFSLYEKHRHLILDDILSSLARLPSSKKNLRSYRLNADEQIQMVTALALQLIQSVVMLPPPDDDKQSEDDDQNNRNKIDKEVIIVTSYENAMRSAHNFLSVFLNKCTSKGEEDYRPLFENFVYDLLATANKPQWPAAELLLSLLGSLLVKQFSNKTVEMSSRVASLDYLGIVAARLRKDSVSSHLNQDRIDDILCHIYEDKSTEENSTDSKEKPSLESNERSKRLQTTLLDYLLFFAQNDTSLHFARRFYIAQWFRDSTAQAEKLVKSVKSKSKNNQNDELVDEIEADQEVIRQAELNKKFLLDCVNMPTERVKRGDYEYDNVCLVTRYLASNRPFSQSFDIYLTQILKVLRETAVAVRTKALKCLTTVVEADPSILARPDMQQGVYGRFLDQSTLVREAAVELIGKFILIRPELTSQYYDMLSARILDTGISVRKRVIKIFRDICVEQSSFDKIPEMCVKMIRRVNDEEGIKKLVNETFQTMWFTYVHESYDDKKLLQKVMNITDVVQACKDTTGYEWFEQLLENLLKKEESAKQKPVEEACKQIIRCLVENVLRIEEFHSDTAIGQCSQRLTSCLSTLFLFCKVKAELLVPHLTTIQPYLNIKCSTQDDHMVLHNVAKIMEQGVPLMEHPSQTFLAQLEEDVMKLILRHGMMVIQSCVSCLGSIVNNVTHNYKLVRDCFQRYHGVMSKIMADHKADYKNFALAASKPTLLRSLFTVGLLCRHFDFDSDDFGERKVSESLNVPTQVPIRDRVFSVYIYFLYHEDEAIRLKSLMGLGYFCMRHYDFMLGDTLRDIYYQYLSGDDTVNLRIQVLRNIQLYLTEEEIRMMKEEKKWRETHEKEDLKEMGDIQSGMASTIIQIYLNQILESFFHVNSQVRSSALGAVTLILRQGLVQPVKCVPYLISMGTDSDSQIRLKADQQLQEIDRKYPGFIQMKVTQGIKMSFRIQQVLQTDSSEPVRGLREEQDSFVALNSYIYSLIRSNRSQRRAVLSHMLYTFDESAKTSLSELLYIADNLAYFPFLVQDEPLFIIHNINNIVSISGSNVLQSFKDIFYSKLEGEANKLDEEDDEDIETLKNNIPDDVEHLKEVLIAAQGCVLLLVLKNFLKEMYGFNDSKIYRYSPSEQAKVFDKPLNRRSGVILNPKFALETLKNQQTFTSLTEEQRQQIVEDYIDFKNLMLSIDPDEDDESAAQPPKPQVDPENSAQTETAPSNPCPEQSENASLDTPIQKTPKLIPSSRYAIYSQKLPSMSDKKLNSRTPNSRNPRPNKSRKESERTPLAKQKKKKKRRRVSDSDSSNYSDDPDFVA